MVVLRGALPQRGQIVRDPHRLGYPTTTSQQRRQTDAKAQMVQPNALMASYTGRLNVISLSQEV